MVSLRGQFLAEHHNGKLR